MRWLALALVAAVVAGCTGAGQATDAPAGVEPMGSVAGVVVDEAVRPLAGARISVPALPEHVQVASDEGGLFRMDDVPVGVAILLVERVGYLSTVVQVDVAAGEPGPLVRVSLASDLEQAPYVVQESFDGFIACGVGSAAAFGLTAPCQQLAGAGLDIVCRGQDPVPPTGACVGGTSPYYLPQASGDLAMAQSELAWDASVAGAELMVVQWAMQPDGQLIKGIAAATGPSFLVSRLNATVLHENSIPVPNLLALYVSVGNGPNANVVLQQSFRLFHTTTFYFELEPEWTFIEDGAPLVPPACTTCLAG